MADAATRAATYADRDAVPVHRIAEIIDGMVETRPRPHLRQVTAARIDRGPERPAFAEAGVGHLWLLDPAAGLLEAFARTGSQWLRLGTIQRGQTIGLPPFGAVPCPLDHLFPFDDPSSPTSTET